MTERESPPHPPVPPSESALEPDAAAIKRRHADRAGGQRTDVGPGIDENRREHARYPLTADAEVVEPQTRTRFTGRATDISSGGCYLDTFSHLPVGTSVYVRLSRTHETFQSRATFVYCLAGMGLGLSFRDIAADQCTVLAQWIAELSGQPTAGPEFDSGDVFAPAKRDAASASGWREAVGDLLKLLSMKNLITEAEAETIRKKLSQ